MAAVRREVYGAGVVVVVTVELVVLVLVLVVVQAVQTLPLPADVPPAFRHVVSSCVMWARVVMQSASVSQAWRTSLLQTPAAVPSPGLGSLQVPAAALPSTAPPPLPRGGAHAQRATGRRASRVRQSDCRS